MFWIQSRLPVAVEVGGERQAMWSKPGRLFSKADEEKQPSLLDL